MLPISHGEKLIETKVCKQCQTSFSITDKDLEFYDKVSPVFNGKKCLVPTPTLCPDCRQQRRLTFRNERKLYKRKCDATGKSVISVYSPDKNIKVYHQDFWWWDWWNALNYGFDYTKNHSFFEQFYSLFVAVPKLNACHQSVENGEYTNFVTAGKDSYLICNATHCQDSLYANNISFSNHLVDVCYAEHSENVYDSIYIYESQDIISSFHCKNSSSLYFCFECHNCHDCILSSNQNWKQYTIQNQQYSKEEYLQHKSEFLKKLSIVYEDCLVDRNKNILKGLHNASAGYGNENVSGDIILNSKDVKNSFEIYSSNNIRHSQRVLRSSDCMDVTYWWFDSSLWYELHNCWANFHQLAFCSLCWPNNSEMYYCIECSSSSNLFGCIGLRNKQYCILNKQYTKAEYETLVPKIIEHMQKTWEWWEFFPASLSPFWYNETVASEYFPLEKSEALKLGYNWSDYEAPFPKVEKIIPASKLPDDIAKIPDDILNWAIECEVTWKPFRIIKQELEFYRKYNLPIPRRHPDQRHLDRMSLRNPRKLFERTCDKCQKDILTTYSPERSEIVYCEECYNNTVA